MARFIAKYAKYRHGVRTGRFMVLNDGQRQELSKELFAKFEVQVPTPDEKEIGMKVFQFHGLPEDRDTNEHVSPRNRISGLDTEDAQREFDWTDEEREIVESVLRNSYAFGDEFIEITALPAPVPWPTYDTTPVEKILDIEVAIGADLEEIARYEAENQNREAVLAILSGPVPEVEDDSVLIEA